MCCERRACYCNIHMEGVSSSSSSSFSPLYFLSYHITSVAVRPNRDICSDPKKKKKNVGSKSNRLARMGYLIILSSIMTSLPSFFRFRFRF